jgi:hypothetical protein
VLGRLFHDITQKQQRVAWRMTHDKAAAAAAAAAAVEKRPEEKKMLLKIKER